MGINISFLINFNSLNFTPTSPMESINLSLKDEFPFRPCQETNESMGLPLVDHSSSPYYRDIDTDHGQVALFVFLFFILYRWSFNFIIFPVDAHTFILKYKKKHQIPL